MANCSGYDVIGGDGSRGEGDNLCPKNWQVIKTQQNIAGPYIITFDSSNTGLAAIAYESGQACRLFFRPHHSSESTQVAVVQRLSTYEFSIQFESGHTTYPGMFLADLVIYEMDGTSSSNLDDPDFTDIQEIDGVPNSTAELDEVEMRPVYSKRLFLEIEPNNIADQWGYPLSIAEVRLALRDACPAGNYLLDDYEYTDKEIFHAINRVVDRWNETPPTVALYSYASFPFRYYWTIGVMGTLLRQASMHKLRNWLPYSGGGVQVNDQSVWKEYETLGQAYNQEFKEWMMAKKVELNIEDGWRSIGGGTCY